MISRDKSQSLFIKVFIRFLRSVPFELIHTSQSLFIKVFIRLAPHKLPPFFSVVTGTVVQLLLCLLTNMISPHIPVRHRSSEPDPPSR